MFRALTIIAVVVALAVSAAPIASAGSSKKPPPTARFLDQPKPVTDFTPKAGPPKPRGITKDLDIPSTDL